MRRLIPAVQWAFAFCVHTVPDNACMELEVAEAKVLSVANHKYSAVKHKTGR